MLDKWVLAEFPSKHRRVTGALLLIINFPLVIITLLVMLCSDLLLGHFSINFWFLMSHLENNKMTPFSWLFFAFFFFLVLSIMELLMNFWWQKPQYVINFDTICINFLQHFPNFALTGLVGRKKGGDSVSMFVDWDIDVWQVPCVVTVLQVPVLGLGAINLLGVTHLRHDSSVSWCG